MIVTSVTIGAPDPRALADFYSRLLEWRILPQILRDQDNRPEDGWAPDCAARRRARTDAELRVREGHGADWPSVRGEPQIQEHLDIAVNDLEASVRWAVEVGATLAEYHRRTTYGSCSTRRVHPFLPSSSAIRAPASTIGGEGHVEPSPGSAFLPWFAGTARAVGVRCWCRCGRWGW